MKQDKLEKRVESTQLDPWSLYIYAMEAPMTRDRYQTRLAKFFDSYDDAYDIIEKWLDMCSFIKPLDFKPDYHIKQNLNNSIKVGYLPINLTS